MSLTKRQEGILFAIIEEYAEVATPVGSVTLAKLFDVSSATIRAEMARLEELGYIAQPHTSAGRVPTDAGYRYYVNMISEHPEIAEEHTMVGAGMIQKPPSAAIVSSRSVLILRPGLILQFEVR